MYRGIRTTASKARGLSSVAARKASGAWSRQAMLVGAAGVAGVLVVADAAKCDTVVEVARSGDVRVTVGSGGGDAEAAKLVSVFQYGTELKEIARCKAERPDNIA